MNDETYWYGVGWPRLVKRASYEAFKCLEGTPDKPWLIDTLWPILLKMPNGAGDAISCLLGEPERLLRKLQAQQSVSRRQLTNCLRDYLWEQKMIHQGDASAETLRIWQAIRVRMREHFPENTDWTVEDNQRQLQELLVADSRQDLPRKLTTLQDYLWRFKLRPDARTMLDVDADDVHQLLRHTGDFSEVLMERLEHCLDELQREAPELFIAVQRELDRDPPDLDCSPATQTRRKQAGSEALAECMEPVTTL